MKFVREPSFPLVHPVKKEDGSLAVTEKDKCDLVHSSLCSPYDSERDVPSPPEDWGGPWLPWEQGCSEDEAKSACVQVQSTTAGPDSVTVRLVSLAWGLVGPRVTAVYNECIKQGVFPEPWKVASVVLIPKEGRDRSTVKGYRPISLLPVLGKGLERLVARRVGRLVGLARMTHPQQGGFLPCYSTTDLLLKATHDIEKALGERKSVALVTGDVEGAYNAAQPNRVRLVLRDHFLHPKLLDLVADWMTKRTSTLWDGNPRPVTSGIPQGSPLSPVLFTLLMTPYMVSCEARGGLSPTGAYRNPYNYADDVAEVVVAPNEEELLGGVRRVTRHMSEWGQTNGLRFDLTKTEVVVFQRKRGGGT